MITGEYINLLWLMLKLNIIDQQEFEDFYDYHDSLTLGRR